MKVICESTLVFGKNNKENVFISYVIPTYNRPETLLDTVLSIINQSNDFSYEIIISDNSTKTESNKSLDLIRNLNDSHILYFVNKHNLGMIGNWNNCFYLSNGKYVSMIHDDDLLTTNYAATINACIKKIEKKSNFAFIKTRFKTFTTGDSIVLTKNDIGNQIRELNYFDELFDGKGPTGPPTCGIIFNREIVIKYGGFKESYFPCSDHYLGFELLKNGEKGYITKDELALYRWGQNESLREETIIGFINQNSRIRDEIYKLNKFCVVFGKFFKNIQFSMDIDIYIKFCQKYGINFDVTSALKGRTYINSKFIKSLYVQVLRFLRRVFCKKYW